MTLQQIISVSRGGGLRCLGFRLVEGEGMNKQEFIDSVFNAAVIVARTHRINPAIATAQAALESAFGKSELAAKYNNLFGMKDNSRWDGEVVVLQTSEWSASRGWYKTPARWPVFKDWQESLKHYALMIEALPWYADSAANADDPEAYLKGLINRDEPAYATDPNYFNKVWAIVEQYGLLDRMNVPTVGLDALVESLQTELRDWEFASNQHAERVNSIITQIASAIKTR